MSLMFHEGDATRPVGGGMKVIVHVCNDVGGWGKGFVTALSRRWPEPERCYRAWYRGREHNDFGLGAVQLVSVEADIAVANLVGQRGLRRASGAGPAVQYDAIRLGLSAVRAACREPAATVHMPRIGCGLAGGRWEEIEPIVLAELVNEGIPVTVYDLPS